MAIEIRVPALGESVTEATVGTWFKKPGEKVEADEPLVELETDKVTVEVPAPSSGVLAEITANNGETVEIGALLGSLKEGSNTDAAEAKPSSGKESKSVSGEKNRRESAEKSVEKKDSRPDVEKSAGGAGETRARQESSGNSTGMPPSPAARKALQDYGIDPATVEGSGRRGQILKSDVTAIAGRTDGTGARRADNDDAGPGAGEPQPTAPGASPSVPAQADRMRLPPTINEAAREERVRMTRLRQTIARRLKDAQNTAAILTTFNDADMGAIIELRSKYKDGFERRHGVKLGFMGFFIKACIQALKEIPAVNAEIDGGDIIYKNYYHIGVAVGTDRGLVVPVLREAEHMTLAEIEARINDFGRRAREGKLGIEDLQGGTFTISNGGVYGSMLSTPILNAPQSGILGMHRIEQRAVVRNGEVVARPMMYLALSYDHRIVDGQEAVTFLVRVKECLEDPQRLMLEL